MQLSENHKNQYSARTKPMIIIIKKRRTKLAIRITNIIPHKVKIANLQNNSTTHIITFDPYYQKTFPR